MQAQVLNLRSQNNTGTGKRDTTSRHNAPPSVAAGSFAHGPGRTHQQLAAGSDAPASSPAERCTRKDASQLWHRQGTVVVAQAGGGDEFAQHNRTSIRSGRIPPRASALQQLWHPQGLLRKPPRPPTA